MDNTREDMFENTLKIEFLKDEFRIAQSYIRPTATGHIHSAISWMKGRLEELEGTTHL